LRYLILLPAAAAVLGLALLGCGSSGTKTTPRPVPGGAAARAADSAPGYCRALTASAPLLAVGRAMSELAANPQDDSAKATLRKAAAALGEAAKRAPHRRQVALASAAAAIAGLGNHGLGRAAGAERALVRAGHLMERPCGFPVG
jgi:hypothetical protein